jgi:hypothetical protein
MTQLALRLSAPRSRGEAAGEPCISKAEDVAAFDREGAGFCMRKHGNGTAGGRIWPAVL